MARITPIEYQEAAPDARVEWDRQVDAHGRMTNMKRTLARSPEALRIYMEWYALRDRVREFLGERITLLFAHAISSENDCLICSTYFRRDLIESGGTPEDLPLSEREQAFVRFGRAIARDPNRVPDDLFREIESHLEADRIVTLTAFAGLMVATNIVNNVLQVDLDDYLAKYRERSGP